MSYRSCQCHNHSLFCPPLHYPEEWDTHLPACKCDICRVSITSVSIINSPIKVPVEHTPENKIKNKKPESDLSSFVVQFENLESLKMMTKMVEIGSLSIGWLSR